MSSMLAGARTTKVAWLRSLCVATAKGMSVGLVTYALASLLDADTLSAAFGSSETPLRIICPGLLVLMAVWLVWFAANRPLPGRIAGATVLALTLFVMLTAYPVSPWPVPFGAPNQTGLSTAKMLAHGAAAPVVPTLGAVMIAAAVWSKRRN